MVTETTTQSWGSRVGGAFKGILLGLIFIALSAGALFWNEGRTIKRAKALTEGANNVITISADSVKAENEGKLVYLTGDAVSEDELVDPYFNIGVNAIKLVRKVEVYQWEENVETKTERGSGGKEITTKTYTYQKAWHEGLIDSSQFKENGHNNPANVPVESASYIAQHVNLGAFVLSSGLIGDIGGSQEFMPEIPAEIEPTSEAVTTVVPAADSKAPVAPVQESAEADDDDQAPGDLYQAADVEDEYSQEVVLDNTEEKAASRKINLNGFVLVGNSLYKGDPENVQIGDIRVSYTYVASPTTISVVSQQQGNTFVPYQAKTGTVELLNTGVVSADQMFAKAQSANKVMGWLIRVGGFFVMLIGFNLLFQPLTVLVDIIPFASRIVGAGTGIISFCLALCVSLFAIAIGWLSYRPLIAIPLLVVAAAALLYPLFKGKKQPKA